MRGEGGILFRTEGKWKDIDLQQRSEHLRFVKFTVFKDSVLTSIRQDLHLLGSKQPKELFS